MSAVQVLPFSEIATRVRDGFNPIGKIDTPPVVELENIESDSGRVIGTLSSDGKLSVKNAFKAGDVLFGKLRPYLRKYANPNFNGVCSSEIWVFRPASNEVDPGYLYFIIQSERFIQAANLSSGSKMPRAEWAVVSQVEFEVPSLPEQRRIADDLSAVDAKIDLLGRRRDALARFKAGLMQKLFSQEVRFTREDGSAYPDWEEKTLNEVADVTMGQSPPSSSYNNEGIGLPLIQGNADTASGYSAPRRYTSQPTKRCQNGDVLISVRAPVGDISIAIGEACIGRGIAAVRAKTGNDHTFIHQLLLAAEDHWQKLAQGSTFTAISGPDVRSITVTIPCLEEQRRLAAALSDLDLRVRQLLQQIATVQAFKKGLLQQMFV